MKTNNIEKLLKFDALQEAENLTGKSYKEDKSTEALGFLFHIENSKHKNDALNKLGDSTFSNTEENYLKIVRSIGFESILIEPFINRDSIEERLHVMWNDKYSILLVFDTHTWGDDGSWGRSGEQVPPPSVNSGNFYYNWTPNFNYKIHPTSSGGYINNGDNKHTYTSLFNKDFTAHIIPEELRSVEPKIDWDNYEEYKNSFNNWCIRVESYIKSNELIKIWSGSHDCREAIKFNISQLAKNGKFLKRWKESPFLWLLNYMDTEDSDYDYKSINNERLSKLPKYILNRINYNKQKS